MIIICGKTIAEVEKNLEMAKMAVATGMPCGIGGATIEDVKQAMAMLHKVVGSEVAITNPNYIGVPPIEDEDEIFCPVCDEPYDGEYCEHCGYDPNESNPCGESEPCEDCDYCCGCSCQSDDCEDEEKEVDPGSAFIKWLEQMNAPLDIISVAKGMFQ